MRPLIDMDTIQIELTDACINRCSNCTRFCGHRKPFFMTEKAFKNAVDSMVGYPKMTGFMGGEPLLHPQFEEFCRYAISKIPKNQLGLWTCLPKGYEKYRDVICETFGHIFINDHTREDIYHAPILVASDEVVPEIGPLNYAIDKCWIQNCWSASINPRGAFFCEIAASMSILFEEGKGWPVVPGWWWKVPKDFGEQVDMWCHRCGAALPLVRRVSNEIVDDISPRNLERLRQKSLKIKRGEYVVSDLKLVTNPQQMAAYKDFNYRSDVAARFGIFLEANPLGFLTPYPLDEATAARRCAPRKSIFSILKQEWEDASIERKVSSNI